MHRGVLQSSGDLGEIHGVIPDHLLALLELDAADILAGPDLQVLVKQRRQIAGAHIHCAGHHRHGKLLANMLADVLLRPANDLIF